MTIWRAEWKRPQAVIWQQNGQELEVAMYVRSLVAAESRTASVAIRTLVRQQQEALGISIPGMMRNRWKIGEPVERATKPQAKNAPSARDRFQVLSGGK